MRARVLLLLALAGGCSFESTAPVALVSNVCASDADCVRGMCDGEICIDDTNAFVEVAIEVLGDNSGASSPVPASWAFMTERFNGSSVRDLILPATREVRGIVRWDGLPVPATLRFVRHMPTSVAPLKPVPVTVDTTRGASASESASYDFSTSLVDGETYDVVVLPTDDMVTSPTDASAPAIRSLPPLYRQILLRGGDPAEPFRFDVEFPANLTSLCTNTKSTGCTLEGEVFSSDGETDVAEPGLQVRAVDKVTGLVVSSVGETSELGAFAIRLGADASAYSIRVTSSVGRDPFPAVSVDPEVLFSDDGSAKIIRVPRLDPVQYTGRVRDEEGAAVSGANVRFLSSGIFDGSQLGLVGSFTGATTTNEDGSFGVELLPGLYSITVTPPEEEDIPWGVLATEAFVIDDVGEPDPLVVPTNVELVGGVTTFNDEGAAGVTVLARARQSIETETMNRSQEVVSEEGGIFRMRMDRGLYDMHVKIPSETGYAWLVEPALLMDDDVLRNYRLAPPIPIEGILLSSGSAPVSGAQLRAYVVTLQGGVSRLLQVAETTTDEEGNYRLLIAPRLGAL